MKNYWYITICICAYLESAVEIDNKSSLPFKITRLVYEQNDGLHKIPQPEFTAEIITPYSNLHLGRKKMITELTGIHADKSYTFKFSPYAENVLIISPDNEITILGPIVAFENEFDVEIPKNYKPIAQL